MEKKEYTISELSRLSGVSTRTLRWYDEIGLLAPSRVAQNGYRHYGQAEVDRLADTLQYRALGVGLCQIRRCLDDPAFDRVAMLRKHLDELAARRRELDALIRSAQERLRCEERNEIMGDERKFEAFKAQVVRENEASFGREARQAYGDSAVDEAQAAVMGLTRAQYEAWTQLGEAIIERLECAVNGGESPQGEAGRELTAMHRRWLSVSGNRYDAARHRGLAQLYTQDARFTAYYDRNVRGCASFLADAVARWAGEA